MKEQTVEIPLSDYIELLDERRRYVDENYGWSIPSEVYDYFIEQLESGCTPDPAHSAPMYVIDNLAVNSSFGPVENYDVSAAMVSRYIDSCDHQLSEESAKTKMKQMRLPELRRLFKACDNGNALFAYEDSDSEYGLGVCYSLWR
jgi:beta-glucanase (GH16 family)